MANFPAKGGLYGSPFDSSDLDQISRALLIDERWTQSPDGPIATQLTYAFPKQASDYTTTVPNYPNNFNVLAGLSEVSTNQRIAIYTALDMISSFTKLTFVEILSPLASDAALRLANTGGGTSYGGYPWPDPTVSGDVFLASNGSIPTDQYFGTDPFLTVTHEIGHALGLKHGHETDYHGALPNELNDNEFSVMTYASWLGSPAAEMPTAARPGS